ELAELLAAAEVGLEPGRILAPVERADVFGRAAPCFAPADAVDAAAVLEGALLDHSWITSFPSAREHRGESACSPRRRGGLEELAQPASRTGRPPASGDCASDPFARSGRDAPGLDPGLHCAGGDADPPSQLRSLQLAAPDRAVDGVEGQACQSGDL